MSGETSPTIQRLATVDRLLGERSPKGIASLFAPLRKPLMDLRKALEQEREQLVEKLQTELSAAAAEVADALGLSESDAGYYRGEVINAVWRETEERDAYPDLALFSRSDVSKLESALDEQHALLQWIKGATTRPDNGAA